MKLVAMPALALPRGGQGPSLGSAGQAQFRGCTDEDVGLWEGEAGAQRQKSLEGKVCIYFPINLI